MDLKKNKVPRLLCALTAPLLAVVSAVCCTLLYVYKSDLFNVDNVYEFVLFQKSPAVTAFTAFAVCSVILFACFGILTRKTVSSFGSKGHTASLVFPRSAAGLFLLFAVVMQFTLNTAHTPYDISSAKDTFALFEDFAILSTSQKTAAVLLALKFLSFVFALPAAAYFLVPVFVEKKKLSGLRGALGIFLVGWLCLQILLTHFFVLDHLNSPARTLRLLSLCALIFFFLTEMHFLLPGKPLYALHAATGMAAGFFAVTDSVPKIFLSLTGKAGFHMNISAFYTLSFFALGLYALVSSSAEIYGMRKAPANLSAASEPEESGAPAKPLPQEEENNGSAAEQPREERERSHADTPEEENVRTFGEEPNDAQ